MPALAALADRATATTLLHVVISSAIDFAQRG
jgi:hypothetical protein